MGKGAIKRAGISRFAPLLRGCRSGARNIRATSQEKREDEMNAFMQWCAVLLLALAWSHSSLADNCSGNWSNVTVSAETLEVAKGHTVTYFVARGSTTSANSAFNGVGECGGYALATPDGKVRVAGICTR